MVDWEEFYNGFREPDFVPGYEIQHRLGGGAFGEVYKARKLSIDKPYAIKFLKLDDAADRDVIERELNQVRLFASIDHPNLVTIEDMGMVRSVPYLIMGYAGEETLARRLKRDQLDRDAALRTFVQVCRGVLALHDRRLGHFDLKPGNVFLKGDVARVGDYGLAKLLVEGRSSLSFGRGTPHYMAPEMLKNRADHRADIYSLGVILYECVTGRVPFGAGATSGVIVRESDDPPAFPADFPPPLRPTVEACLRLDPNHRFDSVHELLEDMGQTARQGDSVRIPWQLPPRADAPRALPTGAAATPTPTPGATGAEETGAAGAALEPEDPGTPFSGEELRQAASELARGAVEVARGVWDGVRGHTVDEAPTPTPGGSVRPRDPNASPAAASDPAGGPAEAAARAPLTGGDEVVSFQTLSDPDSVHRPAANMQVVPPAPEGLVPQPALPAPPLPPGAPAAGEGATALPVPVPPRGAGGVVGTVTSAVVLGAEILGAILTGPVVAVLRSGRAAVDGVVHGLPGVLGAAVRLVLFMLLCMGLGAVAALVFMGAVMGGNLYIQ
ncbi:MAG: serine/threonine-protein kinase [Planctomycetota bacterium]